MYKKDIIIVGGGPAGLAAAIKLRSEGFTDILIIERQKNLGGILLQCIHDGFGLTRFKETLSGPEYAERFIDEVESFGIPYIVDTTVIEVTNGKKVVAVSKNGILEYQAKAVILTMGCRERTRGAISIPGERPAGIYNAGVAQAYINLQNKMVGKEVIIIGSGDIGMIMARRLALEGAHVKAVFEIQPYPSGLNRNIQQCLYDFDIPLYLSHTVTNIRGRSRITGITVAKVDENKNIIPGSQKDYDCDTLILSVGLIPENELTIGAGATLDGRTKGAIVDENYQTDVEGIFVAGNVLHVHDLVDFVSLEAEAMAEAVTQYIKCGYLNNCNINVNYDGNIGNVVPQKISGTKDVMLTLRVKNIMKDCEIQIKQNGKVIKSKRMKKVIPAEMIQIQVKSDAVCLDEDLEVAII